jgi:hypothetical protein
VEPGKISENFGLGFVNLIDFVKPCEHMTLYETTAERRAFFYTEGDALASARERHEPERIS